jgi:hypothetical protein
MVYNTSMNRRTVESDILNAFMFNDREKIKMIYIDLVNLKSKLDRWFNKYLDMFDDRMNSSDRNDPVWKLYHSKFNQYSDVTHTLKIAEYYLNKK